MLDLCKKVQHFKKSLLFLYFFIVLTSFSFASNVAFDDPSLQRIVPEEPTTTSITEGGNYSINTNATEHLITSSGDIDNINDTQFNVDDDGILSILTGWLTDLFYTKDEVNSLNGTWEIGNDTSKVPYTGASKNIDIGYNNFSMKGIFKINLTTNYCYGEPISCTDSIFDGDQTACESQGCNWNGGPPPVDCEGTPTSCSVQDGSNCSDVLGCKFGNPNSIIGYPNGTLVADVLEGYAPNIWGYNDSDRTTTTIVVASSSSNEKEKADYICDGVNDELEIEAAMSQLPSEGGRVFLLEGEFELGGNIDVISKTLIEGTGFGTRLDGQGAYNMIFDSADNVVVRRIFFKDTSIVWKNSVERNFILDNWFYDFTNERNGIEYISAPNGQRHVISGNYFEHTQFPIHMENVNNMLISNNVFQYNDGGGINISNSNGNMIYGNFFNQHGGFGTDSAFIIGGVGNEIHSNVIYNATINGMEIYGKDNLISNNIFQSSKKDGLVVFGNGTVISNNKFQENNGYELNISAFSNNTMVTSNNLHDRDDSNAWNIEADSLYVTETANYPGSSSYVIQSVPGQEIRIKPEGVLAQTLNSNGTTFHTNISYEENWQWLSSENAIYAKNGITFHVKVVT